MTDVSVESETGSHLTGARNSSVRRGRRLTVAGILLAIVVVVQIYLAQYQPLRVGSVSRIGAQGCVQEVGRFTPHDGDEFQFIENTCHDAGDELIIGFGVRNDGRWPVSVLGFSTSINPQLERATLWMATGHDISATEPFRPFRLEPDQERWIEYRTKILASCDDDGGGSYTSLGRPMSIRVGPFQKSDVFYGVQFRFSCPATP